MHLDLTGLADSAARLNRTVDGFSEDDLAVPSSLPGWSRGHVVAHLALNAEALAGVLEAAAGGSPAAMYADDTARDADIEELAAAGRAEVVERLLAATTRFSEAADARVDRDGSFTRTPGAPLLPVAEVPRMRWRELEIHHADLATAYTHHDWPRDFVVDLLGTSVVDQAESGPFTVSATDLGLELPVGGGSSASAPVVSGRGADLAWWLTGRGDGEGLACEAGPLPTLGPWRRASATAVPTPET